MKYKTHKHLALLSACGILAIGLLFTNTALTQDYIDPSQNEGGAEQKTNSGKADPKDIKLETDYEERLRKQIEQQLKDKERQALGQDNNNKTADDTSEQEPQTDTINCGSTTAGAINAIIEAAAKAAGNDAGVKRQAGATLTSLIKTISESYGQLPSQVGCGNGGSIKNIAADAKKFFQDNFIRECQVIAQEAAKATKTGGSQGFNRYIGNNLWDLSNTSLNTTITDSCLENETNNTAENNNGTGSIVSGSGSGAGQGSGSTNQTSPSTTQSPSSSGSQSYPNFEDSPEEVAYDTQTQSFSPVPEGSNSDNQSFGEGSRRLALRSAHEANNYANCTFYANNAPVTDCKNKLDKVLWDRKVKQTQSIDLGTYIILHEICTKANHSACKENASQFILINSGYRSPQTNSSLPGAAKNSYHMRKMAVDFVIPGVSPSQSFNYCMQLSKGGCGKYPSFTHEDSGPRRSW